MKKVGILTFHYVDNYGAVLQTWALREVLNRMPDVQAEIINYVPDGYMIYPNESSADGIIKMKRKRELFEQFLMDECQICTPMIRQVTGEGFDYCCVGSDQVWEMRFRENAYKEYLFPNLINGVKHFSYAASMGECISEENRNIFKERLQSFSGISVREERIAKQLAQLGIDSAEVSLDPTLLLDAEDYEKLIIEPEKKLENYLFFFSYTIGDMIRKCAPFVNMMARRYGLNILHSFADIPDNLFAADKGTMNYEGIGQFLWYIKNAKIVVTTSYHGAIFGNIFNRPTFVICRNEGRERFEQLNKILNLQDYIVNDDWLLKEWNIDRCNMNNRNLGIWKQRSMEYLKKVLE